MANASASARKPVTAEKVRRTNLDRSTATREQILTAVVNMLHDQGFAALTNAGIITSANVSSGAMMHHFPTRQALLVESVKFAYDNLSSFRVANLNRLEKGLPRFRALIDLAWATSRMPDGIAVNEIRIGARSNPDLAVAPSPSLMGIASNYARFIGRYTREAGLTPTADVQALSATSAMAVRSLAIDRFTNPSPQMVVNVLVGLRTMRENIIAKQLGEDKRIDPSRPNIEL
ncbi:MAG: TetR/AcrR family transcriptional regulator [Microvirga sp.]